MATKKITAKSHSQIAIGDVVAYATHHKPGTKPVTLDATGTITRVAFGPPGQRLIEINGKYLRLETEVRPA